MWSDLIRYPFIMRILIFLFMLPLHSLVLADTIKNMMSVEKIAQQFEQQMDLGKSCPQDVVQFIEKLKLQDEEDTSIELSYFIVTLELTDYKNFDDKQCENYKTTILYAAFGNRMDPESLDDLDIYDFHALKILSKVCDDESLLEIEPQQDH